MAVAAPAGWHKRQDLWIRMPMLLAATFTAICLLSKPRPDGGRAAAAFAGTRAVATPCTSTTKPRASHAACSTEYCSTAKVLMYSCLKPLFLETPPPLLGAFTTTSLVTRIQYTTTTPGTKKLPICQTVQWCTCAGNQTHACNICNKYALLPCCRWC